LDNICQIHANENLQKKKKGTKQGLQQCSKLHFRAVERDPPPCGTTQVGHASGSDEKQRHNAMASRNRDGMEWRWEDMRRGDRSSPSGTKARASRIRRSTRRQSAGVPGPRHVLDGDEGAERGRQQVEALVVLLRPAGEEGTSGGHPCRLPLSFSLPAWADAG